MTYTYTIKRSDRKTMEICIKNEKILVRVPRRAREQDVRRFVADHEAWIQKHLMKQRERMREAEGLEPFAEGELKRLVDEAKRIVPERVRYYAAMMNVSYGRITIRKQRTKWGSCSAKGDLNFNCLLVLAPSEVLDSVVVHELCHRKQMNHSAKFYEEVLAYCPDYYRHRQWLKEHGYLLLKRLPTKK